MSNVHKIKIQKGYPDGKLKLSPSHTIAKNKDFINWTIKKDIEVTSIEEINKKSGVDIFKAPPQGNGDWSAEIKDSLPDDTEYEYSITWNGKYGRKVYDPKISVNPSKFNFLKLFIFLVPVFLGLFSLALLRWKKKKS